MTITAPDAGPTEQQHRARVYLDPEAYHAYRFRPICSCGKRWMAYLTHDAAQTIVNDHLAEESTK